LTERKKNPQTKANYYLLDDPDVKRWHDNVGRSSPVTSSIWLRRLDVIHKNFHETPKDLAKMTSKEAANFMLDVVSTMERNSKRGGYISGVMKPMRSWFAWNEIPIVQKIKMRGQINTGKEMLEQRLLLRRSTASP